MPRTKPPEPGGNIPLASGPRQRAGSVSSTDNDEQTSRARRDARWAARAMKKEQLEQQRRDAAVAELEGSTPATDLAGSAAPEQGAALLEQQQRFGQVLEQIRAENPPRWLNPVAPEREQAYVLGNQGAPDGSCDAGESQGPLWSGSTVRERAYVPGNQVPLRLHMGEGDVNSDPNSESAEEVTSATLQEVGTEYELAWHLPAGGVPLGPGARSRIYVL